LGCKRLYTGVLGRDYSPLYIKHLIPKMSVNEWTVY
jgi:hypothetical protein